MTTEKKKGNINTQTLTVEKIYSPTNRTITALMRRTGSQLFYTEMLRSSPVIAAAERSETPSDCNDGHADVHRERPTSKL